MPVRDLARVLMDSPRWVETRDMLLKEQAEIFGLSGDRRRFVAASLGDMALIAVVGRPDPEFIRGAADARPHRRTEVLCAEEDAGHVAAALPEWERIGAMVHAWPDALPLPGAQQDVRIVERDELAALDVPDELRDELADGSRDAPIVTALEDGRPVAFCYATAVTETLWDVSIDTLEPWRRRGHATRAFSHLAYLLGQRSRWPVWGSADDNDASRNLALKLGFVPAERLALFSRR